MPNQSSPARSLALRLGKAPHATAHRRADSLEMANLRPCRLQPPSAGYLVPLGCVDRGAHRSRTVQMGGVWWDLWLAEGQDVALDGSDNAQVSGGQSCQVDRNIQSGWNGTEHTAPLPCVTSDWKYAAVGQRHQWHAPVAEVRDVEIGSAVHRHAAAAIDARVGFGAVVATTQSGGAAKAATMQVATASFWPGGREP